MTVARVVRTFPSLEATEQLELLSQFPWVLVRTIICVKSFLVMHMAESAVQEFAFGSSAMLAEREVPAPAMLAAIAGIAKGSHLYMFMRPKLLVITALQSWCLNNLQTTGMRPWNITWYSVRFSAYAWSTHQNTFWLFLLSLLSFGCSNISQSGVGNLRRQRIWLLVSIYFALLSSLFQQVWWMGLCTGRSNCSQSSTASSLAAGSLEVHPIDCGVSFYRHDKWSPCQSCFAPCRSCSKPSLPVIWKIEMFTSFLTVCLNCISIVHQVPLGSLIMS